MTPREERLEGALRELLDALEAEAKAILAASVAIENYSDPKLEVRAQKRAMLRASEATKAARAALAQTESAQAVAQTADDPQGDAALVRLDRGRDECPLEPGGAQGTAAHEIPRDSVADSLDHDAQAKRRVVSADPGSADHSLAERFDALMRAGQSDDMLPASASAGKPIVWKRHSLVGDAMHGYAMAERPDGRWVPYEQAAAALRAAPAAGEAVPDSDFVRFRIRAEGRDTCDETYTVPLSRWLEVRQVLARPVAAPSPDGVVVPQWIPVSERLPHSRDMVIVQGGVGYYDASTLGWYTLTGFDSPGKPIQWEVTHWMPLPAPPLAARPGNGPALEISDLSAMVGDCKALLRRWLQYADADVYTSIDALLALLTDTRALLGETKGEGT